MPSNARLVVISPHLDDGVLSCGDLLADHPESVVLTAFAGHPPASSTLTSWDERGGFVAGEDVVAARRAEDERALSVLCARPVWLDFPDPQYGARPTLQTLVAGLETALDALSPEVVVMPLGLFHDDHRLTNEAALRVAARRPSWQWFVYADAIYRGLPNLVDERVQTLAEQGLLLRDNLGQRGPATERKRRAVACYASQVRALERSWESGISDAFEPERYWQMLPSVTVSASEEHRSTRDA